MFESRVYHYSRCKPRIAGVALSIACVLFAVELRAAESVNVLVLFDNKALLYIDGHKRMMNTGETSPEGVTLVSADTEQAVIEMDGVRETLLLGTVARFPAADAQPEAPAWQGPEQVSLWADASGFFYASGSINGYPVRFLVDTGANTVAISSVLAQQIGIDWSSGRRGLATTAGGISRMVAIELKEVTVGEISLRDVDAGIVMGAFPETPLLGMSFLGQLDMLREGNRMDLKRRF